MINFIFLPIQALFSRQFYLKVSRSTLGKGFLYLAYLACVFALGSTIVFGISVVPAGNQSMKWIQDSLPAITFTKEGVTTTAQQPFSMTHPRWGTLLVIDTTRDTVSDQEMKKTIVYLTKKKLYFWNPNRMENRIFDLTPKTKEMVANWRDFTLTGPVVFNFYKKAVPFTYPFVFIFCAFLFFVWKLIAGLFYSLIALLLNLFRKARFSYDKLLNLSFFALTPVILLQWLGGLIPRLPLRLNFFWALLITTLYLGYAIFGTQSLEEGEPT